MAQHRIFSLKRLVRLFGILLVPYSRAYYDHTEDCACVKPLILSHACGDTWLEGTYVDSGKVLNDHVVYSLASDQILLELAYCRPQGQWWNSWCIVFGMASEAEACMNTAACKAPGKTNYVLGSGWVVPSADLCFVEVRRAQQEQCPAHCLRSHSLKGRTEFFIPTVNVDILNLETLGSGWDMVSARRSSKYACWVPPFHPKLCCQPPGGIHQCFDAQMDYQTCCGGIFNRLTEQVVVHNSVGFTSMTDEFTVDIIVRAFYAEEDMLGALLESVVLFWPFSQWDTKAHVILDEESSRDLQMCRRLPAFVSCHFESLPGFLYDFTSHNISGTGQWRLGALRAMWSLHVADKYSNATWLAIMEPDVVLFTYGIEHLLFDRTKDPKPVMFGSWRGTHHMNPMVLGLNWTAEFMDSFPFVMCREHLKGLRSFYVNVFNSSDFDQAYAAFMHKLALEDNFRGWWQDEAGLEAPSFHAVAGHYLWEYHRDDYFWSIEHGAYMGVPGQHSCPSLRVGTHAGVGPAKARPHEYHREAMTRYDKESLTTRPDAYRTKAFDIMGAGISLNFEKLHSLLFSPDAGSRWNSKKRDSNVWPAGASSHCMNRSIEVLWNAYTEMSPRWQNLSVGYSLQRRSDLLPLRTIPRTF